jgi:hypothetical protein
MYQQHGGLAALADQIFGVGSDSGAHLLLNNGSLRGRREHRDQQAE